MTERDIKEAIIAAVGGRRDELIALSLRIHDNPEEGRHEIKAQTWLTDYLEANGFTVEKGVGGMPTSFRASYGKGKPVIAFLAEYDALPDVGHACGHNVIAGAAVGAGIAARHAADLYRGTVLVIGTPAEELYGGKIIMADRGAFKDIDAALMVHPGVIDTPTTSALACITLYVEFFGREAHAAANPETGINALEAMILSYNAVNSLRQHIKPSARIHGIITDGGKAANVVPGHSAANFLVRAEDDVYLQELKERVLDCFAGAAKATGARLEYRWEDIYYKAMRNNFTLADIYRKNMESLGRKMLDSQPYPVGSTDMGNVSQILPGIHGFIAIADPGVIGHTREFAAAAASERAMASMLCAAQALAMTAADLFSAPDLMKKVKNEFESNG
jgi:amidohydrolase